MCSGVGDGVQPPPDCSIRAPSAHRVGATPRGVSPRPRALHRPCKPRHPPRAHPCVIIPVRVSRTRAHAGQESAPISRGQHGNSFCCSSSAIGLDRSRHDTPLSMSPCGTSYEVESGGAPVRYLRADSRWRFVTPAFALPGGMVMPPDRQGTGSRIRHGPSARALDLVVSDRVRYRLATATSGVTP
jgi:hypothetical protein